MTENPASTTHPTGIPSGVPPSMTRLADHWGLVLTYGLITIGFGLVLALWPDETLKVLAVLIGIQFIHTGAFRLVLAVASRSLDGGARAVTGLFGALAIVLGLLCLRSPLQTVLVIGMILGVWWLAAGLVDIVGALRSSDSHRRGWDLGLGVLVIVVCVWLFSYGAIAVVAALVLRSEERRTTDAPLPGSTRLAT